MQLEELKDIFGEDEFEELESNKYESEYDIDVAIIKVKEINEEVERYKETFKEHVAELERKLNDKVEKLEKRKEWELYNLKQVAMNSAHKKETKTQYKYSSLSGDIIIKKSAVKMVKPNLDADIIKSKFADYAKEKVELNWAEMKKVLIIDGDVVKNAKTGEVVLEVELEETPEKVEVK